MGCHTWSYRKLALSDETKQKMRETFEKKYEQIFSLTDEELFNIWQQELRERFPELPEEELKPDFTLQDYSEELDDIRKELQEENILEQIRNDDFTHVKLLIDIDDFIDHDDELILFHNGSFYIEDEDLASDMFRVDYTDKMFTDAESLIAWLETQKYVGYYKDYENLGLCDELRERICNLFAENPDILIEFG